MGLFNDKVDRVVQDFLDHPPGFKRLIMLALADQLYGGPIGMMIFSASTVAPIPPGIVYFSFV